VNNYLSAPGDLWPMFREGLRWETMPVGQIGRRFDTPIMMIPENAKGRRRRLRAGLRDRYRKRLKAERAQAWDVT
jgi:hypothetical protein